MLKKQFIFIFSASILMFINPDFVSAQSTKSSANEGDYIVFLLDRLEQVANQAEPLYKKAKKGNIKDRKQLIELYGEGQVIVDVLNGYDSLLSDTQSEQMEACLDKIPKAGKDEDEMFLEGLAPAIVNEKLKMLDKETDRIIKLIRQMDEGKHDVKEKFITSVIELGKLYNIIGYFELTAEQTQDKKRIAEKSSNVLYDGQVMTLENVLDLLLGSQDMDADDLENIAQDEYNGYANVEDFIDRYEMLLGEMVPLMGRMKDGDAKASQEYIELVEKIQALANDAGTVLSEITPEQANRLQQIAEKVTTEINNLSGTDIADLESNSAENELDEGDIQAECSIILDEYELWVDQYIALYPRVVAGEQEAIEEMQGLSYKVQAIVEIISDCSASYSKEEKDRIQRIEDKLSKAFNPEGK